MKDLIFGLRDFGTGLPIGLVSKATSLPGRWLNQHLMTGLP